MMGFFIFKYNVMQLDDLICRHHYNDCWIEKKAQVVFDKE